ncbi:MAG: hypothetical protein JSS87_08855 [Acidobacteria bacterium]|nr:hypothetical protein [Acidobacteriota bacterium]
MNGYRIARWRYIFWPLFLGVVVAFVSLIAGVGRGLEALISGVVTAAVVTALMFVFEWSRRR